MPAWLLTLLGIFGNLLANHSGEIVAGVEQTVADGTSIFHDIANGEGGVKKLAKVAGDLGALAGHAATVLNQVAPPNAQVVTPPGSAPVG